MERIKREVDWMECEREMVKGKRLKFGRELKEKGIGYFMYLDKRKGGRRRKILLLWGFVEGEKILERNGFRKWKDRGIRKYENVWVRKEEVSE